MTSVTTPDKPPAVPDPTALPAPARSMKPLSTRTIATVGVVVLVATGAAITGLLWWINTSSLTGTELTTARLDAIKIGLSIAFGGGGVFALYLAWRRQRSNEADHQQRERALLHQQQVAADTRHDALERRVTDLYTKAADQLGSDKAQVRLAGLYALERVGQDNANLRQTIVDVLCAYLRMDFEPPFLPGPPQPSERLDRGDQYVGGYGDQITAAGHDTAQSIAGSDRESILELQVRLTAQRILATHLRPRPRLGETAARDAKFWSDIDLDLTGAVLVSFSLSDCRVREARFNNARFVRGAWFKGSEFAERAVFRAAEFDGDASFEFAEFGTRQPRLVGSAHHALFTGARFHAQATFRWAQFGDVTWFTRAEFNGPANFEEVKFLALADFGHARFVGDALFARATFTTDASFAMARFMAHARFMWATIGSTTFDNPEFSLLAQFGSAHFARGRPLVSEPRAEVPSADDDHDDQTRTAPLDGSDGVRDRQESVSADEMEPPGDVSPGHS